MEVGEEEGGAPPFFFFLILPHWIWQGRGGRERALAAPQRNNSRLFNKLGQTERTAPPLRERREQEQHIPRNAEQRHSRAKKNSRDKNNKNKKEKLRKRTTTQEEASPPPLPQKFFFFFFLVVETHISGGRVGNYFKKRPKTYFLFLHAAIFVQKKKFVNPSQSKVSSVEKS
jgi:hypothetical protein